ncbi:type II secretion system F family protein [Arthrobacter sp. PsM3]|uniref:type II secretion system F family protein n=1 Tax=Arthrobacter sp. PsM3 TaxID=3030531 RepID=UPI00263AB522|nr:type II secretion system F family protein [Arthrobacter sp. PsM3]MDN4644603.1 type II secretion system F family protein [Arthrobacter sp. PsM3]
MTADAAGLSVLAILAVAAVTALSERGLSRRRLRRQLPPVLGAGNSDRSSSGRTPAGEAGGPGIGDAAMMLELIGAMLDAGAGLGRALALVAELAGPDVRGPLRPVVAALAIGADWETAWRGSDVRSPELLALRQALGFAALTGAPSSAILFAQAARMRRERFRSAEKQAAALGVKLVVPLGLCSLPAFICLGVVPVLLAMLPG